MNAVDQYSDDDFLGSLIQEGIMFMVMFFSFMVFCILSALLQDRNHPAKNYVSPALTLSCGLILLIGGLLQNPNEIIKLILGMAILVLAASDFMFERSVTRPNLFPIAMVLGVLSGFAIGISINYTLIASGSAAYVHFGALLASTIAATLVFRLLKIEKPLRPAVIVYLIQAIILLTGGIASLYFGKWQFAVWGIFLFLSDSLVGIRAFPNPDKINLSKKHLLWMILGLYYPAQLTLVFWVWQTA